MGAITTKRRQPLTARSNVHTPMRTNLPKKNRACLPSAKCDLRKQQKTTHTQKARSQYMQAEAKQHAVEWLRTGRPDIHGPHASWIHQRESDDKTCWAYEAVQER